MQHPGCPVGRGEEGCLGHLYLPTGADLSGPGSASSCPSPLQLGSFQKPPEYTCLHPLLAFEDSGRDKWGAREFYSAVS